MSASPQVLLYTTPWCPFCIRARSLLRGKGIDYTDINVAKDRDMRKRMTEITGRSSVPQVFIGDEHVGGSDELAALDRAGQLDSMLGLDAGSA